MAKTTQTHKDKPSKSLEPDGKHDIEIDMPKMIVGSTSKKEVRHVAKTHGMTFSAYKHACYLRQNDMEMTSSPSSYTKRCTSKDIIYLPYLLSR